MESWKILNSPLSTLKLYEEDYLILADADGWPCAFAAPAALFGGDL